MVQLKPLGHVGMQINLHVLESSGRQHQDLILKLLTALASLNESITLCCRVLYF